jgi:hypothetical protein
LFIEINCSSRFAQKKLKMISNSEFFKKFLSFKAFSCLKEFKSIYIFTKKEDIYLMIVDVKIKK